MYFAPCTEGVVRMFNKLLDPEGSKLPRLAELGPEIGVEVSRLDALNPVQLAIEIMTKAFSTEYTPGGGMIGLGGIADCFLPDYGAPELATPRVPRSTRSAT